jgi:hypothetical protein
MNRAPGYMLVAAVLLQTLAVTGCYSGAVAARAGAAAAGSLCHCCVAEELRQDGYAVTVDTSGIRVLARRERRGPGWSRL